MKQKGFTLFETILVLAIASIIILLGLKQYTILTRYNNMAHVEANISLLLSESSHYYLSHCISNTSLDKININYQKAKTALDAATSGLDITNDLHLKETTLTNPFGQFDDGASYKVTLTSAPFTVNPDVSTNPEQNDKTYGTQGFNATILWQTRVTTCVTTFGYVSNDENSTSLDAIKAYFNADSANALDETCTTGVVLTWTRQPRSITMHTMPASARGAFAEYNKMGQWASFMQPLIAQYGSDVFNYLCQN